MLASITLQGIPNSSVYPFTVPAIRALRTLEFARSRITFFTGENGSGKSTLLEAIALNYGLSLEGGNRNFAFDAEIAKGDTYPLARALKELPAQSHRRGLLLPRRDAVQPRHRDRREGLDPWLWRRQSACAVAW
jgi:predicted ATPase